MHYITQLRRASIIQQSFGGYRIIPKLIPIPTSQSAIYKILLVFDYNEIAIPNTFRSEAEVVEAVETSINVDELLASNLREIQVERQISAWSNK